MPLAGGVSARTAMVAWADGDGATGRVVVRRAGVGGSVAAAAMLGAQATIGVWARARGVPAPELYLADTKGDVLGEPCLVFGHVSGQPDFGPVCLAGLTGQMAESLQNLHAQDTADTVLAIAPDPRLQYQGPSGPQARVVRLARAALAGWEDWDKTPLRVLHGDFWPGNLLWADGKLVAVIDWEEAVLGDPLRDLAITCLDLRWLFGPAAPDAFVRAYKAIGGAVDRRRLAYWQLWAGLRPLGQLERWASAYPPLGRPDVTPRTMQAALEASLSEALGTLSP